MPVFCRLQLKIKVIEGDLSPLKGQKVIKTEFTYDNRSLVVSKEADYIAQKKPIWIKKNQGGGSGGANVISDGKNVLSRNSVSSKYAECLQ
jgi:hypothetical protein